MRDKFIKFMYGRYGVDELSRSMLACSFIVSLVGIVVRPWVWWASLILFVVSIALMTLIFVRMFSKNINRRVLENHTFLAKTAKIRNKIKFIKTRYKDRKIYKYVKCPHCKSYSRVPKGKGRIKITCRVCKKQFEKEV